MSPQIRGGRTLSAAGSRVMKPDCVSSTNMICGLHSELGHADSYLFVQSVLEVRSFGSLSLMLGVGQHSIPKRAAAFCFQPSVT